MRHRLVCDGSSWGQDSRGSAHALDTVIDSAENAPPFPLSGLSGSDAGLRCYLAEGHTLHPRKRAGGSVFPGNHTSVA
jgi:hypothetical protein